MLSKFPEDCGLLILLYNRDLERRTCEALGGNFGRHAHSSEADLILLVYHFRVPELLEICRSPHT